MKILRLSSKVLTKEQLVEFKKREPSRNDVDHMINEETIILVDGKQVAVYKMATVNIEEIRQQLFITKFHREVRGSGIVTQSVYLNASARVPRLDNKCHLSALRKRDPEKHAIYMKAGLALSQAYRKYFPKLFVAQVKKTYSGVSKVHYEYRVFGTPHTGGVINKDTAIGYHFDGNNNANGISCMQIFKKGVTGGELILPGLNVGFECQDGYMLLFDGQSILHGVTPIVKLAKWGYRYTIVFYNSKGMHQCLPPDLEQLHYQNHLQKQTEKKIKHKK